MAKSETMNVGDVACKINPTLTSLLPGRLLSMALNSGESRVAVTETIGAVKFVAHPSDGLMEVIDTSAMREFLAELRGEIGSMFSPHSQPGTKREMDLASLDF